jgi:Tol biopolymer transport system component
MVVGLLVTLGVGLACESDSIGGIGGGSGIISFVSDRGTFNVPSLWAIDTDGQHPTPLTPVNRLLAWYEWSPDGQRVVAILGDTVGGSLPRDSGLWILNSDGSVDRRILKQFGMAFSDYLAWSPDGLWLAFASEIAGTKDIYRVRWDGTGLLRLSSSADEDEDPQWSPEGSRIAFQRINDSTFLNELWIMNADGGNAHRLPTPGHALHPKWSPDGSLIAYDDYSGIWVVATDSSPPIPLTPNCTPAGCSNTSEYGYPSWSPDGLHLMTFGRDDVSTQTDLSIFVLPSDGSSIANLSLGQGPRWSPDGNFIVFEAGGEIARMRANGTGVTPLTARSGPDYLPRWKP